MYACIMSQESLGDGYQTFPPPFRNWHSPRGISNGLVPNGVQIGSVLAVCGNVQERFNRIHDVILIVCDIPVE